MREHSFQNGQRPGESDFFKHAAKQIFLWNSYSSDMARPRSVHSNGMISRFTLNFFSLSWKSDKIIGSILSSNVDELNITYVKSYIGLHSAKQILTSQEKKETFIMSSSNRSELSWKKERFKYPWKACSLFAGYKIKTGHLHRSSQFQLNLVCPENIYNFHSIDNTYFHLAGLVCTFTTPKWLEQNLFSACLLVNQFWQPH